MRLFQSMLLAVDGSSTADAALGVACSLAADYGGRIAARHVIAMEPHLQGRHIQWFPELEADKRRAAFAIAHNAEDRARALGITLRVELVDGDPVEAILAAARATAADTIVIGNRGQSALSTLLLGSVAAGITQRSTLPVLVVHDPAGVADVIAPAKQTTTAR